MCLENSSVIKTEKLVEGISQLRLGSKAEETQLLGGESRKTSSLKPVWTK